MPRYKFRSIFSHMDCTFMLYPLFWVRKEGASQGHVEKFLARALALRK